MCMNGENMQNRLLSGGCPRTQGGWTRSLLHTSLCTRYLPWWVPEFKKITSQPKWPGFQGTNRIPDYGVGGLVGKSGGKCELECPPHAVGGGRIFSQLPRDFFQNTSKFFSFFSVWCKSGLKPWPTWARKSDLRGCVL